MTPADVLDAAADLIETQGRFREHQPRDGKHCPVTAIWRGRPLDDDTLAATSALHREVGPIVDWNDNESDDAVVLATMRHVAQQLRETDK